MDFSLSTALQNAGDYFPQRALLLYGLFLLALSPIVVIWFFFDTRSINKESPAIKPVRFLLSIGTYLLTLSYVYNFVQPPRFQGLLPSLTVWISLIGCSLELTFIITQAARARRSHFNNATRFDAAINALMAVVALPFLSGGIPLIIEIATHPRSGSNPLMLEAILTGFIVMQILGGGTGVMMGIIQGNGSRAGSRRVPLFGWTLAGGDIRVAHFFAIHAVEIFPVVAGAILFLDPASALSLWRLFSLTYIALTIYLGYWAWTTRLPTSAPGASIQKTAEHVTA